MKWPDVNFYSRAVSFLNCFQVRREKNKLKKVEEENKNLKYHLCDMERLIREKERNYLEAMIKTNAENKKVNKEIQCKINAEVKVAQIPCASNHCIT